MPVLKGGPQADLFLRGEGHSLRERPKVMPDDDDNLRRAEEHVAGACRLVLQQKGLISRIRAAGIDNSNAERIFDGAGEKPKDF